MKEIHPVIRTIYYLVLNNGKISSSDNDVQKVRGHLPMTIHAGNANIIIKNLLDQAANEAGVDKDGVISKFRKFDWCDHWFDNTGKTIVPGKKRKVAARELKKSNFAGVFRRVM